MVYKLSIEEQDALIIRLKPLIDLDDFKPIVTDVITSVEEHVWFKDNQTLRKYGCAGSKVTFTIEGNQYNRYQSYSDLFLILTQLYSDARWKLLNNKNKFATLREIIYSTHNNNRSCVYKQCFKLLLNLIKNNHNQRAIDILNIIKAKFTMQDIYFNFHLYRIDLQELCITAIAKDNLEMVKYFVENGNHDNELVIIAAYNNALRTIAYLS